MPAACGAAVKLTKNQFAGLQEVARCAPLGSGGVHVVVRGPLSGTTQKSLRDFGLVTLSNDGRRTWATITEGGLQLLTAGTVSVNSLIITVPKL